MAPSMIRWPWVSRLAYEAVSAERDRLAVALTRAQERCEEYGLTMIAMANGRHKVDAVVTDPGEHGQGGTLTLRHSQTPALAPLSPEVSQMIAEISDGNADLKAQLTAQAYRLLASDIEMSEVPDHLLEAFKV